MAEKKDSGLVLKAELESMDGLDMDLGLNNDSTADMVELKNRMDKSDQEMRAMTEAMKSTLLDVRTLMQDMDNPFNMLRDMGVDKLVSKAVETVEDEVNKQKREETKKRLAGGDEDEDTPVYVNVEGSSASNPSYPVAMRQEYSEPRPRVESQIPSPLIRENPNTMANVSGVGSQSVEPVVQQTRQAQSMNVPVENIGGGLSEMSYLEERMSHTEEAVNKLAGTVNDLAKVIHESNSRKSSYQSPYSSLNNASDEPGDYYEAYVGLIADYLQIRLGDKGSEEILLEGMYKEWASAKVVRDIMDKLSSSKKQGKKNTSSLGAFGNDVEDKMLITSLLRNLDKPVSEWGESTHLFLLLALVSRARENQVNRS
ncbi:MAG: hypothetical protein V1710_07205 [Candidatus Bathyarchaeota archaeon]